MTNKSSLYARALVAIYELLDGADWPGPRPQVGIGQFNEKDHGAVNPAESVLVLTTAPMDSQQDWASLGCDAHDEQFVITVEVITSKPGRTVRQALGRLEELSGTVEATVRGSSGARVDGQVTAQHELVAGLMKWWHPVAVDPWIGPREQLDGFDAACTVSVGVSARI